MNKQSKAGFRVEKVNRKVNNIPVDQITTFYEKGKVVAQYCYWKNQCNYLLSYGFEPESLGAFRKNKCTKQRKPFFSLDRGFYTYQTGDL